MNIRKLIAVLAILTFCFAQAQAHYYRQPGNSYTTNTDSFNVGFGGHINKSIVQINKGHGTSQNASLANVDKSFSRHRHFHFPPSRYYRNRRN